MANYKTESEYSNEQSELKEWDILFNIRNKYFQVSMHYYVYNFVWKYSYYPPKNKAVDSTCVSW